MTTATLQRRPRLSALTVSEARRTELRRKGYKVEDMGAEYGPSFAGKWRFINIVTGDLQEVCSSASEDDAWLEADMHCTREERE